MINFKRLSMAAVAVSTFSTYCAIAQEQESTLSANVGVTSNYMFRGVTLTDDDPAVSVGVDYEHGDGVYFGAWASNLSDSNYEVDIYAGFASELGGVGYDFGYIQYTYPKQASADYAEVYLSLSYSLVEVGAYYTVDSEINDGTGTAFVKGDIYYYISVGYDIADDLSLGGTLGSYAFEDDDLVVGGLDYSHAQVDLTKSMGDIGDFTLSLSIADEVNGVSGDDDLIPFVSWVKTF